MILNFSPTPIYQVHVDCVVVGTSFEERPLRGHAGLLDWHLHGQINRTLENQNFEADFASALLVPTLGKLPFRHVVVLGLGSWLDFDADKLTAFANIGLSKAMELGATSVGLFYPYTVNTSPYQELALKVLLEGVSEFAAKYLHKSELPFRLHIPSPVTEEVDLSEVMVSKLLSRHQAPTTSGHA